MLLSDNELYIRAIEPTDIDTIMNWENDTELWKFGSNTAPFSRMVIWKYISNYSADIYKDGQLRLLVCLKPPGAIVGMVDLYDFDPRNRRAYVGIMTDRLYQRKGYGLRAVRMLAEYAREVLHLHQLTAAISADNQKSRALFEKAGFSQTAVLKEWTVQPDGNYVDQTIYQLFL